MLYVYKTIVVFFLGHILMKCHLNVCCVLRFAEYAPHISIASHSSEGLMYSFIGKIQAAIPYHFYPFNRYTNPCKTVIIVAWEG